MDEMDALEQMAWDLEAAQQKRHAKALRRNSVVDESDFWTVHEFAIFETIKTFRERSHTFHPDNQR